MFRNTKIDIVEQRLQFFESLSKEMSSEFKKIIEKLSDNNEQVVKLVSQQDKRINDLDNNTNNINQDLKAISLQIENQIHKQELTSVSFHTELKDINFKILELTKFKSIIIWSVTVIVTILGLLASGGWIHPDRFVSSPVVNNGKQ